MIYQITPLFATGLISLDKIEKIQQNQLKHHNKLPNDLKAMIIEILSKNNKIISKTS